MGRKRYFEQNIDQQQQDNNPNHARNNYKHQSNVHKNPNHQGQWHTTLDIFSTVFLTGDADIHLIMPCPLFMNTTHILTHLDTTVCNKGIYSMQQMKP